MWYLKNMDIGEKYGNIDYIDIYANKQTQFFFWVFKYLLDYFYAMTV